MAFHGKFSTLEKSARSVFVGNISYDVTEEQIRQLFSQGFGFCEFADTAAAEMAIRNFNGHELKGRPLRVDSAASSDRNMEEAHQLQVAQTAKELPLHAVEEALYGKEPEPGKAPEAIAKTVSTLPPEQMFELMKQMKKSVTTNPIHTRQLLMENPQLAYALLQAQVVMRVVDPKVAYSMLHRETPAVQHPFHQPPSNMFANGGPNAQQPSPQFRPQGPPPTSGPFPAGGPPVGMPPVGMPQRFPQPPVPHAPPTSNAEEEAIQAQMLMKVIQLTDEQIAVLGPEERNKVLELPQSATTSRGRQRPMILFTLSFFPSPLLFV
ncbi:BMA-CPF-2, isoform b [Aphelenchoides fujianensis]|nr:BMA-CPF-2, isoform b [Aphelenchoides fujianensis]